MCGKLIVLEGLDGSGKSTQLAEIGSYLEQHDFNVRKIKLPDYDDPSSSLVRMYLGGAFGSDPQNVNAYTASTFYAVDRAANYLRKWKEDYLSGKIILADRYTTSNAYHCKSCRKRNGTHTSLGLRILNTSNSPCRSRIVSYIWICRSTYHSG